MAAGGRLISGDHNVAIGYAAGNANASGKFNTIIGSGAGYLQTSGDNNSYLGCNSNILTIINSNGTEISATNCNNCSFVGYKAGQSIDGLINATAIGSNSRVSASNSLILGASNVNVGIGVTAPREKLEVNGRAIIGNGITSLPAAYNLFVSGGILTEALTIAAKNTSNWADFVFEKNYKLRPLAEVEKYIKENGHLPEIPAATEIVKNGIKVGETEAKLLQKIEELTLYIIEQNKRLEVLENRNK